MNKDLRSTACVPCEKQLLCQGTITVMLDAAQRLTERNLWTEEDLQAWNGILSGFIDEAHAALSEILDV